MNHEPDDASPPPRGEVYYVNYLQVGRTAREIVLEFGVYHAGDAQPRIQARLATHPAYAEEFLTILAQALREGSGAGETRPSDETPSDK
jgi:hypothetical protein